MQLMIFFLCALVFDILLDDCLTANFSYRGNIVTVCPEFSSPQLHFDFGNLFEDFSGCDTFDHRGNLGGWISWNALNEKMDMVLIGTDFQKVYLVPFGNF